jgi:tRNA threonylcarbamoyladenosine biosynthesis protein TsaE
MTTLDKNVLFKKTVGLHEIDSVAKQMARVVSASSVKPFVLWLQGDLGAGKTTFTGAFLHALGLDSSVPVLSPTYTYMTEYQTTLGLCAHLDLYRLVEGDLDSLESLLSGRQYSGLIVEWPMRAALSPFITRTHQLHFDFSTSEDVRVLTAESFV